MQQTFTDFKNNFYARVPDLTLFDCGEINLLKVVLDGLRVNYKEQNKIKTDFLLPQLLYDLKFFVKRIVLKIKSNNNDTTISQLQLYRNKFLIGFSQRLDNNIGNEKSIYFENIFTTIGRKNFLYIGERREAKNICDLHLNELINAFSSFKLSAKEKTFLNNLKKTHNKIIASNIFNKSELNGIRNALEVFFIHYKSWNKILKTLNPPLTFFDQHYHREGFILACKENNVTSIELQHGLIVPEDIFYIFPKQTNEIIERALFADKILVYGDYWRNNLLMGTEYSKSKINTIGFYHHVPNFSIHDNELSNYINNTNIILITTQVNISNAYSNYIKTLSSLLNSKKYNWKIIIKIHPSENIENYSDIVKLSNCMFVSHPLEYLFSISKIHISIYSTTLYDALRSNVFNFSLYDEKYKDYCDRIINDKIAIGININEDPVELYLKSSLEMKYDKKKYYEKFNKNKLIELIKNK